MALFFNCNQVNLDPAGELSFEEYLSVNNIADAGDFYIFEEDIAFPKEFVEKTYNETLVNTTNSRGNICIDDDGNRYVWSSNEINNLTYSFTSNMATGRLTDTNVKNAFRECLRRWMAVGDLRITEVPIGGMISVHTANLDNGFTAWGFPPHYDSQELVINLKYIDTTYNTINTMTGLFTHEFGHCLGLAHEHQRADSPDTFGTSVYGEPFGDYDAFSVMSYANRPYLSGISIGDAVMLKVLYAPYIPPITSGTVTMVSLANQNYVCADNAGASPLIANRTAAGSWEQFQIVSLGNNRCAIKASINGKYVCADNGGASSLIANRTAVGQWETFTLVNVGWDLYALVSAANSSYVCAESKGGAPLIANRSAFG